MTSQGHARTVFRRALERGNLLVAEAQAREVGRVDLSEALAADGLALVSVARDDDVTDDATMLAGRLARPLVASI